MTLFEKDACGDLTTKASVLLALIAVMGTLLFICLLIFISPLLDAWTRTTRCEIYRSHGMENTAVMSGQTVCAQPIDQ